MKPIIFSVWMGPNEMSPQREQALVSLIRHNGCANAHLTVDTLKDWVDPRFPFHPLFNHLSAVHKSDYLRCYMLHVHGGGYTDVKHTSKNWQPYFRQLERSAAYGLGYREVGPQGVARVGGALEAEMQANFSKLIGFCAMIFRPQTEFTTQWFAAVTALIDSHAEVLVKNPARHPLDRLGATFTDGSVSSYPFAWTGVGGDIFHPLAYRFSDDLLQADIAPSFEGYR